MTLVRSLLFNIAFYVGTAIFAIALIPALIMPANVTRFGGRLWSKTTNLFMRIFAGTSIEIQGDVPSGGVIIAAKHQSAWETIIFAGLLRSPCYVLKYELGRIPLFGSYLVKTGQIIIDRKAGANALRSVIRHAGLALDEGRQVIVFPEGTRVPPGAKRPYQPGIAGLYQKTSRPVVPVALNTGCFWPRNGFFKRPGKAILKFLPAIEPGLDRKAFMEKLEQAIESETDQLLAPERQNQEEQLPPAG